MTFLLSILLFGIVLFIYIHIHNTFKTCDDLEIYTLEHPSSSQINEICNLKQPFLLNIPIYNIDQFSISKLSVKFKLYKLNVRDIAGELYTPIKLPDVSKLFKEIQTPYFTEHNQEFLEKTGLINDFKHNDMILRPPMTLTRTYDYWSGSPKSYSPLKHNINSRTFLYVSNGSIRIRLIPPKYTTQLNMGPRNVCGEYSSHINVWDELHKSTNIKSITVNMTKHNIISIPPYWNYSVYYDEQSSICVFRYNTYISTISNIYKWIAE
jgi:hypothetical protein